MTRTTSTTDPSPIAARLLESHPTPTFTVDAQTRILTWNARMEAVTGRRAEDVIGQRAWSAFFERKAPTPIDEAILGGTAVSRPFQLAHPRGEQASVVFRAEAVVDAAGDVIGAIGTLDEPEVETTGSGAFAAVVDAIMSVQEPSAVPGAALEHIRGAYGWRFGAWWTLTDAKGFRIQGESGSIDNAFIRGFRDHGMPADTGLLGRAAAQRDVVAVADLGQVADSPRAVAAHRAGIRSAVVIPVQRGGKVIGVIDLIGRENPVDESEIDQLRAIARGIGHQMDLTTEVRRGHRLGTAIDNAANAIMLISSDFTITYANPASIRLLESYRAELQGLYPGFEPQGIVGINIDRFHKDPRHQRRLLGDSANLPWRSDIRVGPLTFDIQVTASHHTDGAIEGYCLEWRDVTKLRKEEDQVAALRSQIEGSSVSVMLADTDRRITYVNPACRALLSGNTAEMRRYFPGFDANGLVGRCIDDFHANPRHQQSILAGVGHDPIRRDISVGSMRFGLNLVGLRDNADKIIGYAVEWTDQSDRYKYAAEVKRVVDALTNGDLSAHGDVAAMSEMFKPMMGNLNQVIDTLKQPLVLALRYIRAISVGESPEAIDGDYRGDFATLIGAINRLIEVDASIAESAARMAGGDLTVALTPRSDADELLHSLSRMVDNMSTNLRGVRGAADRIAVGSTQVSGASRSVSDEATRAAASVEEISASVEELATQTRYNADNAASAMRLATASCDAAKEGDQQMQSMVRAMGEIDEASQNISRIIKVIDEIAFQTNLLALNAAVEAARAGVHGKGFAVVAEEVRNLAARSARAAKETTEMIEGSLKKVQLGTSLANETARALAGIVDSITQAAELVAQIARASNEQAEGINQINEGLTQVDSVIQQNTANAEEMAAAAVELSSESERLKEMLSAFRLREPQRATDGVQGLSPEMLEAFQQFMARYNGGGAPAPAAPAKERRPAAASPAASMAFDDLDFGKF